jgi:apolipoprotein N-acyltransferase
MSTTSTNETDTGPASALKHQDQPQPSAAPDSPPRPGPSLAKSCLWAAGAALSFNLAYSFSSLAIFVLVYLFCLLQIARAKTGRQAFYLGLGVGFLAAAFQLQCFWAIFGVAAIALWFVVAFWIGLFVALARLCLVRLAPTRAAFVIPFLWTGLEYFRSELYYLRFSWLNVGYLASETALMPALRWIGMYGLGFVCVSVTVILSLLRPKKAALFALRFGLGVILVLFLQAYVQFGKSDAASNTLRIAGVQLEFPAEIEVLSALDGLLQAHPDTEMLMLSEYTFNGVVPEKVKDWCRRNKRYLVVGGKEPVGKSDFYDTAYVVGPDGEIVFRQVKSVPIQFFKDGLPAREQALWNSPWGKIGFCVCYDLSYTRVIDRLVGMGAQALIVPTMDVVDWGAREHELHARVAPVRSAEHGIPIFRVASSGISQWTDETGRVRARADFPGQGERIVGQLAFGGPGSVPVDRWLAPLSTAVTALTIAWLAWSWRKRPRMLDANQPAGEEG